MPPWFAKLMNECESIALDNPIDQARLWAALKAAWPRNAIEAVLLEWVPNDVSDQDAEQIAAGMRDAVISALEES
jgi:hypothetical protein